MPPQVALADVREALMGAGSVTVAVACAVQPLASVTVTLCVPTETALRIF